MSPTCDVDAYEAQHVLFRAGTSEPAFRSILVNARTPLDGALEIPFGS
jgi:hypothetical protein